MKQFDVLQKEIERLILENASLLERIERLEKKVFTKSKRFVVPSIDEIYNLFLNNTNNVYISKKLSSEFYNHYQANGWMIGKNKMKCYKSAVSQWSIRHKYENKIHYEYNTTNNKSIQSRADFASNEKRKLTID